MSVTVDNENNSVTLNVTFTREEWDGLILLLGLAMGAATKQGMTKLSYAALRMANKINEGNPDRTPYWVPEEQ